MSLSVNLIYHQQMVSRNENFPAYALPHLLNRDAGRPPFADVLIIGAGSGNDVSRALQWDAKHVDAVEIDPAIYRLGRALSSRSVLTRTSAFRFIWTTAATFFVQLTANTI